MSRPIIQYRTTSAEAYKSFKEANPRIDITYSQFNQIIRTCNEMIMEYVMETGEKFKLPHGFGTISIHKWRPKRTRTRPDGVTVNNLPIDWVKTRQTGKRILQLNFHTGGYKFRWVWFHTTAKFRHHSVFSFKPNRSASRKLAQYLKIPNSPYVQIYRTWDKLT